MRGSEVLEHVRKERKPEHTFIRWWRKENDFIDYELLEEFLDRADPKLEFGGYELVTTDQMWASLKKMIPGQLDIEPRRGNNVIVWQRPQKEGADRVKECPYIPSSMMDIFNVLTRGNVIEAG